MASDNEILDYLQLINTDTVGPKTFSRLIEHFGSVTQALADLPPKYKIFSRKAAEEELKLARKLGIHILIDTDSMYPQALLNISDHPPLLYAKGNIEVLNSSPALAVVGSRNASVNSRKFASRTACELTGQGVMIISGMARGIDTAAHKGALYANNGTGSTIAVLGTGVDVPYPQENKELYEQITAQGCIISELPIGTKPQSTNFPRRNRIISGLSSAVLVIEASLHSGSLITAAVAAEQGRDVLAVPGSPIDGRSQGSNKLIKDGAFLVESIDDIIPVLQNSAMHRPLKITPPQQKELFTLPLDNEAKLDNIPQQENGVLDFITADGVYIDEIIEESGLDSAVVTAQLLELELEGVIFRQTGGKVALIK